MLKDKVQDEGKEEARDKKEEGRESCGEREVEDAPATLS